MPIIPCIDTWPADPVLRRVVGLSSSERRDDTRDGKALEGGADALLTKPIDFVALRTEIDGRVASAA